MLTIGLTGGIGSGKSTVSTLLAARGATIVDTDAIARELTLPGGAALPALRRAFGDGIVEASGALDRSRMRALVFGDGEAQQAARRTLEGILHPLITAEAARQGAAARGPAVVFDVPLLVESGRWRDRVDRVLVVDCSEATQVERVTRRSGWAPDVVRAVIAQQARREARRVVADAVILNDGLTLAQLDAEVEAVWRRWVGDGSILAAPPAATPAA